eukprot:CAMPEP_0168562158 /NCGR_PEP_ID=MMETSP0413-20121227/11974_1 /TAXON_ID=136452 /ORGANISM="Filamoeba nolandi, Strain NC-AS-23-1" /LENGTH=231 /DNA_ID=CAMNT_0008593567 /DNA_START=195 /DNA_END=890 /DNA_ORIENTATION=-
MGPPASRTLGVDVGQLCVKFNDKTYVGTGSLIEQNGKIKILTCAHNVYRYEQLSESYIRTNGGFFYPGCTQDDNPAEYRITRVHVFPAYLETGNGCIFNGADLAVLEFEVVNQRQPYQKAEDAWWGVYRGSDKRLQTKVYGYPGEQERCGDPYQMIGTISEVLTKPKGKILMYRDIDTTGGQSGSPVLVKRGDCEWTLIAVHVGFGEYEGVKYNIATLLSDETYKWVDSLF